MSIARPDWLPTGHVCWGQHGATLTCYCGRARAKWLRRAASHADGRHVTPQVDCWVCWQVGRFPKDATAPPHNHVATELCGQDCERYWYEREGRDDNLAEG